MPKFIVLRRGDFRPLVVEAPNSKALRLMLPQWGDVVMAVRYHGEPEDRVLRRKVGRGVQDVFLGAVWIGQVISQDGRWSARVFINPHYRLAPLATGYKNRQAAVQAVVLHWHETLRKQAEKLTTQKAETGVQ